MAYLAQHQIFEQIPELSRDILEPDYCIFSDEDDSALPLVRKNFWFGPAGTVSPLHYDRYHNILCQVMGSKAILLVEPTRPSSCGEDSDNGAVQLGSVCKAAGVMYPNEGSLGNTSRVDLQREGWQARFPNARGMVCREVRLRAGEALYIPPHWWHLVLAEETSVSVSFWW